MANAIIEFYQRQFSKEGDPTDFSMLDNVPAMVTMEQNLELCRFPTLEEEVICYDIHNIVLHLFGGASLPKSITHTNLVLLPKKPRVQIFSVLRPIRLSNFINKVISRVIYDRLEKFLPNYISPNQSGFVKGRSIFENILLTQEIVTDIRMRDKPANMVIKLDMTKAYDRVLWKYLMCVTRRIGFAEHFITMVWNPLSNNWYSVLVNGQASGFFKSTRG
uniref:Reverse transcriptase domain-containing protein n=1 Tax=Nicotiana tabacum TaxID=4097 RepID=A0A1S3Z5R7_TOBAC|nr:PREDICTED: uncharacterized protein LOC107783238 [Nicotiana tabacum]